MLQAIVHNANNDACAQKARVPDRHNISVYSYSTDCLTSVIQVPLIGIKGVRNGNA